MKWFAILTVLKLLLCLWQRNWKCCLGWWRNFEYAYVSREKSKDFIKGFY
jgi:hypothetical protein